MKERDEKNPAKQAADEACEQACNTGEGMNSNIQEATTQLHDDAERPADRGTGLVIRTSPTRLPSNVAQNVIESQSGSGNANSQKSDDTSQPHSEESSQPGTAGSYQSEEDKLMVSESLPSRKMFTRINRNPSESGTSRSQIEQLKKSYSFVDVDTVNMDIGGVTIPTSTTTNIHHQLSLGAFLPQDNTQSDATFRESLVGCDTVNIVDEDDKSLSTSPSTSQVDLELSPSSTEKDKATNSRPTLVDRDEQSFHITDAPASSSHKKTPGKYRSSPTEDDLEKRDSDSNTDNDKNEDPSLKVKIRKPRRRSSIVQVRNLRQLVISRENMKKCLVKMRKKRQKLAQLQANSNIVNTLVEAGQSKSCEFIRENFGPFMVCSPVYDSDEEDAEEELRRTKSKILEESSNTPRLRKPSVIEQQSGIDKIIEGKSGVTNDVERSLSKMMKAKFQVKTPTTINGLIHPECELKIAWDLFVGVGVLYTLLIVPYQLSFVTTERDLGLLIFNMLTDTLFAIDICIKLHTAVRDRRGDLITDRSKVIRDYACRGLLLLDVLSCFPIDLIIFIATWKYENDISVLRFVKLLRLARLARLVRCFKIANINLVLDSFNKVSLNPAMGRVVQFVISFLTVTHVIACLWWAVGDRNKYSWQSGRPTSWAVEFAEESSSFKYIVSLYWSMGTMSGVGFGDVVPQSSRERIFAVFAELIGVFAFGLVVGYVSTLVESVSYKNSVHRERHLKMSAYMKQRNLPGNLQKRLNEHIKWSVRNQSVFDEKEILQDFPVSLQQEVMLHSNKHLISIFPLLQSQSSGFLLLVTSALRATLYSRGDIICLEGELGKCMYFVASGQTYAWVKQAPTVRKRRSFESLSHKSSASDRSERSTFSGRTEKSSNLLKGLMDRLGRDTGLSSPSSMRSTDSYNVDSADSAERYGENSRPSHYTVGFCFCGDHFGEAELLDTNNQFRYLSWNAFSNTEIHTLDKETLRRIHKMLPKEYNKILTRSIAIQELFTEAIQSFVGCEGYPEKCSIVLSQKLVPVSRLPKKAYDKVLESFVLEDGARRESRSHSQVQPASPSGSHSSFSGTIISTIQASFNNIMGKKYKVREHRSSSQFSLRPNVGERESEEHSTESESKYYEALFEDQSSFLSGIGINSRQHLLHNNFKRTLSTKLSNGFKDGTKSNIEEAQDSHFTLFNVIFPLHPYERVRLIWDLLLGLIILYNIITIPIRIAFELQLDWHNKAFKNMIFIIFELVFDLMFIIDIGLNFVTAYFKVDGQLVTNFKSIAAKYVRSWLFLDIIASVPFDLILILAQDQENSGVFSSVKMLKTLRVARALKLFRARRLLALLSELEEHLGISSTAFTMLKLGIQISLAGHLMGCLFYFVSDKSWLHNPEVFVGQGTFDRYVASLYWAFTTMTTVGYGDIVCQTQYGYIYSIISMLVGSLIFSFVIGNFSTMAMNMNRSSLQFQKKMDKLNEYMNERNLPHKLRHLCRRYLLDMNINMMAMDEQLILDELPDALASEIMLFVHNEAIDRMAIFDGLDASVITHIISIMKQQIFLPFQYIIVAGQSGYGIIFIVTGEVQLFKLEGIAEIPLKVYAQGSFISEAISNPQHRTPVSPVASNDFAKADLRRDPSVDASMVEKKDSDMSLKGQHTNASRTGRNLNIVARSITYCTTFRMSFEGLRIIHEMYPSVAKRLNVIFKNQDPDNYRSDYRSDNPTAEL